MISTSSGSSYASIREVHYGVDGKIEGWSVEPKKLVGNDPQDLIDEIMGISGDILHCGLNAGKGLVLNEEELNEFFKSKKDQNRKEARDE